MRAVVQRVSEAYVEVDGVEVGRIGPGMLVLLGVGQDDEVEHARQMADKIAHLRIFPDAEDKMSLSVQDVGGEALVVSQFTLYGDCRKGRRPSYAGAAPPRKALELYEAFVEALRAHALPVATGRFQEMMRVHLVNDGPVTLLVDSRKQF